MLLIDASSLLPNIDHLIKSNEPSKMFCTLKDSWSYISINIMAFFFFNNIKL